MGGEDGEEVGEMRREKGQKVSRDQPSLPFASCV